MPRKIIFIATLLFLFSKIFFTSAEVVDKIIVIVNDEIITQGELDRILVPVYLQFKNVYAQEELSERLDQARKSILTQLINDKLLLTEAKRRGIEVTDDEVGAKIKELREQFAAEEEFRAALERENLLLSELKKRHRQRIMIDKLIDTEIKGKISISPNEMMVFYEKYKSEFREPKKIRLRSILIRVMGERPESEADVLAKKILERLEEGGDFALLAREYSEGPYAESDGDMGWVKEGELMPRINDLVFTLDENEISGILKTDLGFHIFKVEEKVPSREKEFDEVKNRIEQIIYNRKVEARLTRWIEELKENAYIAFR